MPKHKGKKKTNQEKYKIGGTEFKIISIEELIKDLTNNSR